jgi:phenylacetate-coenzyme A ligase PaaK-like adenylate-forming protein
MDRPLDQAQILDAASKFGHALKNWSSVPICTRDAWSMQLMKQHERTPGILYTSSGTTGAGRQILYPMPVRTSAMRRAEQFLRATPIEPRDLVAVMFGFGMFPPAQFYCDALVNIGCRVSPLGSGKNMRTDLKCRWLAETNPHVLIGMPTYLLTLAHALEATNSLELCRKRMRCLITGGEVLHTSIRERLGSHFKVPIYDHYGMLEAPMIAGACSWNRLHVSSEYYCEVLIGKNVRPSGHGVLLLSSTSPWDGIPMMRLFTGDEVELNQDSCPCGNGPR